MKQPAPGNQPRGSGQWADQYPAGPARICECELKPDGGAKVMRRTWDGPKALPAQGVASGSRRGGIAVAIAGMGALVLAAPGEAASAGPVKEAAPLVVRSQALQESATGPVPGVFAKRSATATKTDAPLIETPQAITVIPARDIEKRAAGSVAEALRYATGVTTENRGGVVSRYDMLTLRGFQQTNQFLDGLQLQYNGWYAIPQIDPAMIERVEVLKGPASVLYGSTPPGGLINLVSKRPLAEAGGELSLAAGTNDLRDLRLDVTGPLAGDESLRYRIIGHGLAADGQARTTENERMLIAPSLTWEPGSATTLTLLAHYQRDPKSGAYGAVPARGSVFDNPNGRLSPDFYDGDVNWEEFDRTQWTVGYELAHAIDPTFTFRQNARFLETAIDYRSVYARALLPDDRTLLRASIYSDERSRSIAIDNRLEARFTTGALSHTVLFGLDYWDMYSEAEIGYGSAPSLDIFNPDNDQGIGPIAPTRDFEFDRTQTGLYVQDQIRWGGLTLVAGGRKDWYERKDVELLSANTTKLEQDNFSARLGALYRFDFGVAPYASYAESFEPQSGADFAGNPFDPTTGEQVELGVKYLSPDERVFVTAAAFEVTKQNVTTPDPAHPGFSVQTGEIRSRGLEVEAYVEPVTGLSLSGFFTRLDTEYTRDNAGLVGKTPVWVAEHQASLWAEYAFAAGALDGLTLGLGVRHVGPSYVDAANTAKTDAYTLIDGLIEYDLGAVTADLDGTVVRLNGTNLADKDHVAGCYSTAWCWFGEERAVTLTLAHRW